MWSSSFTQIKKLFSLLCLRKLRGKRRIETEREKVVSYGMEDKRGKEQPHTRFHEHPASLEPFLLLSAMGTQAYQIGSGPGKSKATGFKNHHGGGPWACLASASPLALYPSTLPTGLSLRNPHINKLLLFCLRHLTEPVVTSSQVTLQATQCIHHDTFHFSPLGPRAGWRETESPDTSASSDS